MRVKAYNAPTMAEAMRQVRDDLGANAIIVSTDEDEGAGGVRVMAALEAAEWGPVAPVPDGETRADFDGGISETLAYHGVPEPLVARLCKAAAAFGVDDGTLALAGALDVDFSFAPIGTRSHRSLMLIGPPGAGKTSTTAKLAARTLMAGGTINVVTTDTVRAGAAEQLAAFMRVLEQPLAIAQNPAELGEAVRAGADKSLTVVDTAGLNVFAPQEVSDMAAFVDGAGAEPVLVLAAGGDALEAADLGEAFGGAGARRMILTRLDATRRFGGAFAAADAGDLAFAEASITPFAGDGLNPLNPLSLARLVMHDPTHPNVRSQLSSAAS